jgi:S1-C subfamily serine protease
MPAKTPVVAAALALVAVALPGCIIVVDETGESRYSDYAEYKATRRQIGVTLGEISGTTASQLKLDGGRVCVIEHVYAGTPAERAGLREHDIVTRIDGQEGASVEQVRAAIRGRDGGEELRLTVLREGQEQEITVVPERR